MANGKGKGEPGLIRQVCEVFQGPLKGWTYLGLLFALGFTVLFFWSLIEFLAAETVTDHLHWGLVVILSAIFVAMIKIWFWLMMVKNAIVSELRK